MQFKLFRKHNKKDCANFGCMYLIIIWRLCGCVAPLYLKNGWTNLDETLYGTSVWPKWWHGPIGISDFAPWPYAACPQPAGKCPCPNLSLSEYVHVRICPCPKKCPCPNVSLSEFVLIQICPLVRKLSPFDLLLIPEASN